MRGEPQTEFVLEPTMSDLSQAISTRSYHLDSILQAIAQTAQKLTGATGAAVAMWKDGAVVCRASCGEGAPPQGAHLSVESGISGHCLRSGLVQHCGETLNDPRVDAEICRRLGLRSVAVLPIRGWRGVNGILEVFSTEPRAFAQRHFELLQQLAGLAERARAGQPEGPSTVATVAAPNEPSSGLLPASDRVRDLASVLMASEKRNLVLGTLAVLGVLLLGFAIWLGWRNPDGTKPAVNAAPPASIQPTSAAFKTNDPIWNPNPDGETLFGAKRSPMVPATSKPSGTSSRKTAEAKSDQTAPKEEATTSNAVVPHEAPAATPEEIAVVEPPPIVPAVNPATLNNVLSASPGKPELSAIAVSQGVSTGYLIHRVSPIYPPQALMARLEGSVVLNALIAEDGSVRDLKLVSGQPTLARAALQAVRQWRYKPYELDRQPVKMNTTITVKFKLP